jgi:hypothetical protein
VSPRDPATPRVFYRIVWTNPPTERDFFNHIELGRTSSDDPTWHRLATGLSVYTDLDDARKMGRRLPWKGNCFVAELHIPHNHPFVIEKTGKVESSHYTVWGSGQLLRSMIHRVLPVRRGNDDV